MLESVLELLQGIPEELIVFLISLLPILELRGGLIAASLLGIEYWVALPICIIGNLLPIPFILLFIRKVLSWLKKTKPFKKLVEKIEEKAEKNKGKITKYAKWGLYLFVAVPLPGTGAWTGALVAAMLDMRLKHAFPSIALGVTAASAIVTIAMYTTGSLLF